MWKLPDESDVQRKLPAKSVCNLGLPRRGQCQNTNCGLLPRTNYWERDRTNSWPCNWAAPSTPSESDAINSAFHSSIPHEKANALRKQQSESDGALTGRLASRSSATGQTNRQFHRTYPAAHSTDISKTTFTARTGCECSHPTAPFTSGFRNAVQCGNFQATLIKYFSFYRNTLSAIPTMQIQRIQEWR
jgi:hypothetical protein